MARGPNKNIGRGPPLTSAQWAVLAAGIALVFGVTVHAVHAK